jgi:cyclopropane fatty-acyl-phospholipid synthase-like methyltransferase
MTDPRTTLVGAGYDAMIDTWESWAASIQDDPRDNWCADLIARLSPGARVLELGCGGGTRETQALAAAFNVTGIDLSARQLERARSRIPTAEFQLGDFTMIELEPSSLDAVVSFYAFNHVPRELLAPLLARIAAWLTPDGWFMAAFGTTDLEGWTGEFLGATTFFSSYEPETNSALVQGAGLSIVRDEVVTIAEPEGPVPFQWILARR